MPPVLEIRKNERRMENKHLSPNLPVIIHPATSVEISYCSTVFTSQVIDEKACHSTTCAAVYSREARDSSLLCEKIAALTTVVFVASVCGSVLSACTAG